MLLEVIHVCKVIRDQESDPEVLKDLDTLQGDICSCTHFFLIEEPSVIL
jgi:hypothetical protein